MSQPTTTYEILRLGHQGDGIAKGPVFAARTLPGETVTGTLEGDRLEGIRIQTPAEFRISPGCRHYRSCGGCDLQHASDAFVADWKQTFVASSLSERGIVPDFLPLVTSPPQSRRRATFAARRTKSGALAGFHTRRSDVITPVPDCRVLHPTLARFLPAAERLAVLGSSRKTALEVSVTLTANGLDVAVRNGKPLDGGLRMDLAGAAQEFAMARLAWNGETVVTRESPVQMFGGIPVVPPPGAFLQATVEGQEALIAGVLRALEGTSRVADLFSGCGTFALPLAETKKVHAVESGAEMLEAADTAWRDRAGLRQFTTEARDLFRNPLNPDDLNAFDGVVIDPPRAGAVAQTVQLAKAQTPVIAYVSCNPVTFARDAEMLIAAGYRLDWVQVVDQFRWSTHTELVSRFSRDKV